MKKKKASINSTIGDVPAYLVYLITHLTALLGVAFFGGGFLLLQPAATIEPACGNSDMTAETSNFVKWGAWMSNVFLVSISQRYMVTQMLGWVLSFFPEWVVFYGISVLIMFLLPTLLFPMSVYLVAKASFAKCPGFPDSINYAIPFLHIFDYCGCADAPSTWKMDDIGSAICTIFGSVPVWLFTLLLYACMAALFCLLNFIGWSIASSMNSFIVLYEIFAGVFRDMDLVFDKMKEFSISLSFLAMFIVLYGAGVHLSIYVFLGFVGAASIIVIKEVITHILKSE